MGYGLLRRKRADTSSFNVSSSSLESKMGCMLHREVVNGNKSTMNGGERVQMNQSQITGMTLFASPCPTLFIMQ